MYIVVAVYKVVIIHGVYEEMYMYSGSSNNVSSFSYAVNGCASVARLVNLYTAGAPGPQTIDKS